MCVCLWIRVNLPFRHEPCVFLDLEGAELLYATALVAALLFIPECEGGGQVPH